MESSIGKNPQSNKNDNIKESSTTNNNTNELNSIEKLLIKIIRRKKIFIITLIAFAIFGFIRTYKEKIFNSLYEGNFTILIKDPINESSRNISSGGVTSAFETNSLSIKQDIPTLRKLLLSEYILRELSEDFDIKYTDLVKRITIEQDIKVTGVLEVKLLSNNPKKDLKLLKELSSVFVNYAIVQKQKKLSDGLSFLSAQEPAIKEKNIELRIKLENFMKENNLIDPIRESTNKKIEIKELETKTAGLRTKLKRLASLKEEILKDNINTAIYSEMIGDAETSSLRIGYQKAEISNQYETLNKQLREAQLIYTPSSSIVKNIKSKIELIKPIVKEKKLEIVNKSIKTTNDIIELNNSNLSKLNRDFEKLTSLIREYEVLSFELDSANANFTGLNSVKERLQLQIAQDNKPWIIITDPSFNPVRIYPSFRKELTNFALMGTFVGIGLCLLRDKFDDAYHSPEEIRNELKYPLLGHIPFIESFSNVREEKRSLLESLSQNLENEGINSYDKFFYQESLRNIYTSIRFLSSDKPIKVITLTSSVPKEGKSLSNILLAKTLCEMDLKILQIDADLRKPQLHTRLNLNNITGLSNLITNEEINISEAIQNVPGFDNWRIITAGTKPPDPTRLLQSKRMENIISSLRKDKSFDLVLIDTPPLSGLSDALLVSEKSDGLIMLVTTDLVPRALPKECMNKTLESGATLLGVIANSTKKQNNQILNRYGYGTYSYTYNSYSEENKEEESPYQKSRFDKIKVSLLSDLKQISSRFFKWLDS